MKRRKESDNLSIGSMKCRGFFDLASKEAKVAQLEERMAHNDFWNEQSSAQEVIDELNALRLWTVPYRDLNARFQDVRELLPEAHDIGDEELIVDLLQQLTEIESGLSELEIRKMLSGELDSKDCYLEINAGAGGTESCDWAAMLSRMYQR